MTYVRVKLALERLPPGAVLEVWLTGEEPLKNVPKSVRDDGHEVLSAMVADDKLRHFPVVVLTTSYEAADIQKMYKLRCNSYITKPVDFDNFVETISKLAGYWLTVVVIPDASKI